MLSDKSKLNEKITLVDDKKIISLSKNNVDLLNSFFFCNGVENLKILEFSDSNSLAEKIRHPIFKAVLKVSLSLKV